jgi:hypothetical protein
MRTLLTVCATAAILIAGGAIFKAEAAMTTGLGSLPLMKSYTSIEKVGYWRRQYRRAYRRGYYGYGYPAYPYYGYAYPAYPYYGYGYRPYGYYGYGYRPYGYGYGWRY